MNFKNKVVVITGASSGIGEAAALKFSKKGAKIVLVARRKDKLLEVENKIKEFSQSTLVCQCDVSNKEEVDLMSKIVLDKFGRIDILVNNAGFIIYGQVNQLLTEEIISQMETNYFGMIYCTKAFLHKMLEQHSGHIVNVASVGASFSIPGFASYCATKYAMLGFSEGLYHELVGTGVGLTVVSPFFVRTPLLDNIFHPSKSSTNMSISSETVAKAILKASNSPRLEIVVPSIVRVGIWFKQTFPYFINPIIGSIFRKKLTKRD